MTWTAYGLLISYWSSDVCSSDLIVLQRLDGVMHAALKVGFVVGWHRSLPVLDDRRRAFAAEHLAEVAALADVADDDRAIVVAAKGRSVEQRVGNECVSRCRSRWSRCQSKQSKMSILSVNV